MGPKHPFSKKHLFFSIIISENNLSSWVNRYIYTYIKDRPACQCWERQQKKLIIDGMLSKPVASLGIHCYLSRCLQLFADEDAGGRHKKRELFLPPCLVNPAQADLVFPQKVFPSFLRVYALRNPLGHAWPVLLMRTSAVYLYGALIFKDKRVNALIMPGRKTLASQSEFKAYFNIWFSTAVSMGKHNDNWHLD